MAQTGKVSAENNWTDPNFLRDWMADAISMDAIIQAFLSQIVLSTSRWTADAWGDREVCSNAANE